LKLLPAQIDFINSKAIHTGMVAGFGSGKTEAAVSKIIIKKAELIGIDVAYYLPTYNLIKDIALPRITASLEEIGFTFHVNQTDKFIRVFNFGKDIGRIIMRTMDNPHLIVGYEVGYSLIDECDVLPQKKMSHVFSQIIARNRARLPDGEPNRTDVVGTPEGFRWFYDFFVTKSSPSKALIRAKTRDNPFLPKGYINNLQDNYTKEQLAAYLEGEFINLTSGTVYYKYDRQLNYTDREIKVADVLHIGMDFNIENMSAVVIVIDKAQKHVVDELMGVYDTESMCRLIRERYEGYSIVVYPDASGNNRRTGGKSDIMILREYKFKVVHGSRNPNVRDRVNAVNRALCNADDERTLIVNSLRCPVLAEALERQSYKAGEPDKTTGFDHATDALGYGVMGTAIKRGVSGTLLS